MTSIYIAPSRETSKELRHGSQFYLQITTCLPLPRKRSPDGATTDLWWRPSNCSLLVIYLLIPKRWKAELAYLADLQRTVYPHKVVTRQLQVERSAGKVWRSKTDVLPLRQAVGGERTLCPVRGGGKFTSPVTTDVLFLRATLVGLSLVLSVTQNGPTYFTYRPHNTPVPGRVCLLCRALQISFFVNVRKLSSCLLDRLQ